MMEKIRTAANSLIVKIIFGIIILAFIFTGVGGFLGSNSSRADDERLYIAKVDGEGISREAFERESQMATKNAGTLMGDDAFIKMIRQSILSSQIDDNLAYKFSESLNSAISDEHIKNIIRQQTIFFKDGHFNNQLYLELLALNYYTPDTYASALKNSTRQKQVIDALVLSDFSVPVESELSQLINQNRTVYLTNYSISNIIDNSNFVVSDEEIADYYKNNSKLFTHPVRLKMKYVINSFPEIKRDIKVTQEEIEEYYAQGREGTTSPEKQLFSFLSYPSLDEANKEYNNITQQMSPSIKMENIGWFTVDGSLPELIVKANLKKIGEFSKPIEQDGQYYILRLDNIDNAKKFPFEDIKGIISNLLIEEKTRRLYDIQQNKLDNAVKLSNIEDIAKESGLLLNESKWTTEKEVLSIGRFAEIKNIAFSDFMIKDGKPTGNISDVIYVPEYDSTFVIQVSEYQDEGISPLEEVQSSIYDLLLKEKKKEIFTQYADSIIEQLNEKGSADGIKFSQRMFLNRNSSDENIDAKTVNDIFSVIPNINKTRYGLSIIDNDKTKAQLFALVKVDNAEVSDISEQLKQEYIKSDRYYLASDLRSKAKIEIMPDANL